MKYGKVIRNILLIKNTKGIESDVKGATHVAVHEGVRVVVYASILVADHEGVLEADHQGVLVADHAGVLVAVIFVHVHMGVHVVFLMVVHIIVQGKITTLMIWPQTKKFKLKNLIWDFQRIYKINM